MGSVGKAEKADRLSSMRLPLLHHFLSFLPTRDVVQTCLLSRRWQDLWTSVPNLYFQAFHELDQVQTPFPVFVDEVLVCRDASLLRKFLLDLDPHDWDAACARRWVCYAVKHAVEKIKIRWSENSCPQYCSPPRQLLACQSLEYLNLDADVDVGGGYLKLCNATSGAINLPNLQSLKLTSFEITSNCSAALPSLRS